MTVVHFASGDLWAGAEVQLYHLACALHEDPAIRLLVVLLNDGLLAERLRSRGVQVRVIDENRINGVRILVHLIRLLRAWRPDVVHTHRQKENIIGATAARLAGVPFTLRTVHGLDEFPPRPWQLRRVIQSALDRFCVRYLQQSAVAVSAELGGTLRRRDLPASRIVVIENGLDIDRMRGEAIAPVSIPGPEETVRVAFVARLVPIKRVDLFIDIADALTARWPGAFSFYVLGDGPLMAEARERVQRSRCSTNMFFLGFKPAIASYLARMDLLLITSNHEGLPMNLLEALALERPVIAHATGGISEALGNGIAGTLIRDQSIAAYVGALESYLHDPAPFLEKARRGLLLVHERFSATAIAARYKALYHGAVSASPPGAMVCPVPTDQEQKVVRAASYRVRSADVTHDGTIILDQWSKNFGFASPARLEWMYRSNVAGPVVCLVLTAGDAACGIAGLAPRIIKIGTAVFPCGQAIDFAVEKPHRMGRAALLLQRAVADAVARNGFPFAYALPNEQAAKVCLRIGYTNIGRLQRWTKPLRAEYALRKHISAPILRAVVAPVIDAFLSLRAGDRQRGPEGEICDSFDGRFDELWKAAAAQFHIVGERNAKFLNWRFCQAPDACYRIFCLAQHGQLLGYVVFEQREHEISVADFLFRAPQHIAPLFRHFSRIMRRQGAASITISFLGPAYVGHALYRAGFFRRSEVMDLLIYRPPGQQDVGAGAISEADCYFTRADKDT